MPRRSKASLSIRIDAALADRLRTFVKEQAGKPLFLTLTSFCEAAIEDHLRTLEKKVANEERTGTRHVNSSRT